MMQLLIKRILQRSITLPWQQIYYETNFCNFQRISNMFILKSKIENFNHLLILTYMNFDVSANQSNSN